MTRTAAIRAAGRWTVSLLVLVAVAFALRGRFEALDGASTGPPALWAIGTALVANVVANELLVRSWLALVQMGGGHIPVREGRWTWSRTQLARYAVGMAQVASRAVAVRRHGLSAATGAVTTLLEVAWYVCINGVLVLATIWAWAPGAGELRWAGWLALGPGLLLVLALVTPRLFTELIWRASALPVLRRLRPDRSPERLHVTRADTARLTGLHIANAVVRLTAFVALFVGLGGPLDELARVIGAYALGHLVGALAVFAPGGVGPREGATAVVLAPVLGTGPVLVLVASVRLLELVAELAFLGIARLRLGDGGQSTPAPAPTPTPTPTPTPNPTSAIDQPDEAPGTG